MKEENIEKIETFFLQELNIKDTQIKKHHNHNLVIKKRLPTQEKDGIVMKISCKCLTCKKVWNHPIRGNMNYLSSISKKVIDFLYELQQNEKTIKKKDKELNDKHFEKSITSKKVWSKDLLRSKRLTNEEEHWLREYAEVNKFFGSILNFYERKGYLNIKQRYHLRKEINKEENDGDIILPKEELVFLKEFVDIDSDLEELSEIYEIYGCFSEYEYRKFIKLKLKYIEKETVTLSHIDYKEIKRNIEQERKKNLLTKNQYSLKKDSKRLFMGSDNSNDNNWEDLVKLWERLDEEDKKNKR